MTRMPVLVLIALLHTPLGCARSHSPASDWTDQSPHEVRFIFVDDQVRLEVLDWGGATEGPTLVFLAGFSMNAHAFDDFAPRFVDRHRVIGITRRGHGESSWPETDYEIGTLVHDITTVLDDLGIQRVVLVGHSLAGNEMTRLASTHPERVAGLVYIDAAHNHRDVLDAPCPDPDPRFRQTALRQYANFEAIMNTQFRLDGDGEPQPHAAVGVFGQILSGMPYPDYSGVQAPALGIFYAPRMLAEIFAGNAVGPSEGCVVWFQRYMYGGIADFARGIPRNTVVVFQEGQHNLHLALPDEVEAVVRSWLGGLVENR